MALLQHFLILISNAGENIAEIAFSYPNIIGSISLGGVIGITTFAINLKNKANHTSERLNTHIQSVKEDREKEINSCSKYHEELFASNMKLLTHGIEDLKKGNTEILNAINIHGQKIEDLEKDQIKAKAYKEALNDFIRKQGQ